LGRDGITKIVAAPCFNGSDGESLVPFDEESLFHLTAYLQTSIATSGQTSPQRAGRESATNTVNRMISFLSICGDYTRKRARFLLEISMKGGFYESLIFLSIYM
jgi:hypothetical protein